MDSQKTVFNQMPQPNYNNMPIQQKKASKTPVIFLLIAILALGGALIYYFAIYNADPKFKITYSTDGSLELKNKGFYEMLYKNGGNVIVEIESSKLPKKKEYYFVVGENREKITFEQLNGKLVFVKKIAPNENSNSQYSISLTDSENKPLFSDNINVSIVRPNMSSREYVENYLRSYSDAFASQSSSTLYNATAYWESGKSDPIYEKLRVGFPTKVSFWYENVIGLPNDDVRAKVNIFKFNDVGSTSFNYSYLFKLKVVKNNGIAEWKISSTEERLEKKDTFNYGNNYFEGD